MLEEAKKPDGVPGVESAVPEEQEEAAGDSMSVMPVVAGDEKPKKKKKKNKAKSVKKAAKEKKGVLGTSRGIETMFRTSYRTNMDLSGLADTKANIMISINGIIISIVIASISPKIDANPWLLIPSAVLLISCLFSIVYAVLAARPRVSSNPISLEQVRRNEANILFFGNFVNMPQSDFITGMKELLQNTDALYINMIRDIYGLGTVLEKKFKLLRSSYNTFMFGLIAGVILFVGVYAWVVIAQRGPGAVMP